MNNTTIRFIECYKKLVSKSLVKNMVEFAKSIDVSTSMMTEIVKGRSNVGLKAIQNTVNFYPINADWLLTGKGEMLRLTEQLPSSLEEKYLGLAEKYMLLQEKYVVLLKTK